MCQKKKCLFLLQVILTIELFFEHCNTWVYFFTLDGDVKFFEFFWEIGKKVSKLLCFHNLSKKMYMYFFLKIFSIFSWIVFRFSIFIILRTKFFIAQNFPSNGFWLFEILSYWTILTFTKLCLINSSTILDIFENRNRYPDITETLLIRILIFITQNKFFNLLVLERLKKCLHLWILKISKSEEQIIFFKDYTFFYVISRK